MDNPELCCLFRWIVLCLALRYSLTFICFVCLRLVYPLLTVSLDCPLIGPTVFSNVIFGLFVFVLCTLYCQFLWIVLWLALRYSLTFICFVCLRLVYPLLPISLDCPSLIGPTVFSNVYLFCLSSSCVPFIACFSGLSFDWSYYEGYTRRRQTKQINVREYRRANQRWTIQRNWQ
jgi:hypothetical protein